MGVRYQRAADLVELMGILQTTATGLSIDEIAARFEVSRRTAERMLAALRDRIPDLEPSYRAGRKFWLLPRSARSRPLQLPRTIEALSERVVELESELQRTRTAATSRSETGDVLGTSRLGLAILGSDFRVLWVNDSLLRQFGLQREEILEKDMRDFVRERMRERLADGDEFVQYLLSAYASNDSFDDGECHVLPAPGREKRWLAHGTHPITWGHHAGGRIDHFVDLRESGASSIPPRLPEPSTSPSPQPFVESAEPVLLEHLATVRTATSEALSAGNLSPTTARRVSDVFQSTMQTIQRALSMMEGGKMKPESVNAAVTLQTVAALAREAAEERGIELTVIAADDLPPISADPKVMTSALSIGTRYSIDTLPRGSRLELVAEQLEDPTRIRISIRDNFSTEVPGFPEVDGSFVRTRTGGIGLGLALVRDETGKPTGGVTRYFEAAVYRPPAPDEDASS
jgi:signal transduction histidine kinase